MPGSTRLKSLVRENWIRALPIAISVSIVSGIALGYGLRADFRDFVHQAWSVLTSENRRRIGAWVSQFGPWGVVVLLLFYLVQMFAFFLPSWLLIIVSVIAYGPLLGGTVALGGILLAATVAYGFGRLFSEVTVKKLVGEESEEKMRGYLDRYGFWLVVIFRLAPFLSNDIISFVAGLSTMNYGKFAAATVLGISPLIGLIAYLGEIRDGLLLFH